jgi:glucose/arabinose dehydrogenase
MDHWPLTEHPDEHTGYREPTFAWVPSIGVSNLIGVNEGTVFPRWRGDLLVSSMRDESIWRVRIRNDRVAYAERIPFETRIRDILQARDGRLVIWTDEGELISVGRSEAPAQPQSASE